MAASSAAFAGLHVSPAGTDSGAGTTASPLSLRAAFARAEADSSVDELVLAAGVYEILTPIELDSLVRDSGHPLRVRAVSADADVILRGGRSLDGAWGLPAVNDPIVAAMPAQAHSAVRVVTLPELRIRDYGNIHARGFSNRQRAAGELFIDGRRRPLAGYPNVGANSGEEADPFGVEYGFQKYVEGGNGTVQLPRDLAARLAPVAKRDDVWAHGYWGVNWADAHLPVTDFDVATGRMTLGGKPYGGIQNEGVFRIYNLPEELDAPGEWYLHRDSGRLYYWPATGSELAHSAFSIIDAPILRLRNARNVRFEGLVFEASRADLVRVESSTAVSFVRCQFRGSGLKGLYLNGERNLVEDCLFEGIGDVGIAVSGGDRQQLRPGANLVVNSVIREFGEVYLTYSAGIHISGVANVIAQNYIGDAPHEAVQIHGNLNRVLRNEIANVCQFSDDAGAIYSGRDWLAWGNEITANYIHDIRTQRTGPDWVHGIYLDDCAAGFIVRRNIIENVDAYAVNAGGGRYNIIDENLFINARGGHLNDNRGAEWIVTTPGDSWNMVEALSEIDRFDEPWVSTFPGLAMVPADPAKALAFVYPDGSEFTQNAGSGVGDWAHEQDWTDAKEGVFSHYAAFDAKPLKATLPAGDSLAEVSPRRDIPLHLEEGATYLSFSQMGLQGSSWMKTSSTRPAAIAAFNWNAVTPAAGSALRFDATTTWASRGESVLSYEWLVNGNPQGSTAGFKWTPLREGVYRVTLKISTVSGAQDQVVHRIAVEGGTVPPAANMPADETNFICDAGPITADFFDRIEAALNDREHLRQVAALTDDLIEVPVNFNVLVNNDHSGKVSDAEIKAQLKVLNDAFAVHGFRFAINSLKETVNSGWANHKRGGAAEIAMKRALAVDASGFLNVYICADPKSSNGQSTLGYASYPWDHAENDALNGVVVAARTLPGGIDGGQFDQGETLVHAIGHYFGLSHDSTHGENLMKLVEDSQRKVLTTAQGARAKSMALLYRPGLVLGGYLWSDAPWSGSQGWRYSEWLQDWVETSGGNWTFHMTHGWIYSANGSPDNAWFYSWDFGWMFFNRNYPWIYVSKENEWIYYLVGSHEPRWFYRSKSAAWTKIR